MRKKFTGEEKGTSGLSLSTSISSKSASANHCSESAWKAYMCSSAPTNRLRTCMYKPESLWVMCFNLCKLVTFYPVVTLMNFRQNLHVLSDICTEWKTKTEGNKKRGRYLVCKLNVTEGHCISLSQGHCQLYGGYFLLTGSNGVAQALPQGLTPR